MAMTKKEVCKSVINAVLTSGQFYAIWLALVEGNHYAWNVIVFAMWLSCVISMIAVLGSLSEGHKRPTRAAFRMHMSLLTDIAAALFLAAFGHFFYASLTMIHQLIELYCYDTEKPAESVLEYAGIYTAEEIAAKPDYYDNGWASIAVPCEEIEKLCLRVIGNTDKSTFTQRARQRGLKDGTPINGFAQDETAVRCEAVHENGEHCTRVLGHGKAAQSTLGLFHITPSDFVWYTEGLD